MIDELCVAVKAIIEHDGKVLILRESEKDTNAKSGQWGAPGGRLVPGESMNEALEREVQEETGLQIEILRPLHIDEWRPTVKNKQLQIIGLFLACTTDTSNVTINDEHDEYRWIDQEELEELDVKVQDLQAYRRYFG